MATKSVSICIEEEMLAKIGHVADYEGRSVNSHILVLIRESIKKFEDEHGTNLFYYYSIFFNKSTKNTKLALIASFVNSIGGGDISPSISYSWHI